MIPTVHPHSQLHTYHINIPTFKTQSQNIGLLSNDTQTYRSGIAAKQQSVEI